MRARNAGVSPAGPAASRRRGAGRRDGAQPAGVDASAPKISDWIVVSQNMVDRFADVTGDRQWIHVDPDCGETIAHGFLILSLLSTLLRQAARIDARKAINYGLNRVRFIAPVMVGSRIRARFEAGSIEKKDDATKVVWKATIETEERPCCVAEWIVLYYR